MIQGLIQGLIQNAKEKAATQKWEAALAGQGPRWRDSQPVRLLPRRLGRKQRSGTRWISAPDAVMAQGHDRRCDGR